MRVDKLDISFLPLIFMKMTVYVDVNKIVDIIKYIWYL